MTAPAGYEVRLIRMIAPDLESAMARLQEMVEVAPVRSCLSPAQASRPNAASPISARRAGLWTKNRPIPFEEFMSSQEARNESWRRRFAMEEQFATRKPGRGHRALASLYRAGKVPAVITQNIDNLHQASGISPGDVIELHGNTTYAPVPGLRPTL